MAKILIAQMGFQAKHEDYERLMIAMEEKHVIIIAIEKYQDPRIKDVLYSENDAASLKQVYLELGVSEENIFMLVGSEATKTRIESLIRRVLGNLINTDELVIFYAGHGFCDGYNYITCFDTVDADLLHTSIPLGNILVDVKSSKCKKVTIFIDSCHSGLTIDEGMRGLTSNMTDDGFKEFCSESEYYVAFSSCADDEKSYSSTVLKHGIWSYHLLRALRGDEESALYRGKFITASSLQNFLNHNVKLTVRTTFTDRRKQTPQKWGNSTHEFIVADLTNLLEKKKLANSKGFSKINNLSLSTESRGPVRRLSGFKKTHTVPTEVNKSTSNFIKNISEDDIKSIVEDIFEKLKSEFKYKRADLKTSTDHGTGSIISPDFSFNVSIDIDQDNPSQYIIRQDVSEIQKLETLESAHFAEVFNTYFDSIEFFFDKNISIEKIIDRLEELDLDGTTVRYPTDLSYCTVELKSSPFSIIFARESMTLRFSKKQTIKKIVENLKNIPLMAQQFQIIDILSKSTAIRS